MTDTLKKLCEVIEDRRGKSPDKSYVAKMFKKGRNKICQKVGEEAAEVIIASLAEKKKDVVSESADLLFHLCMLWADKGVSIDKVMAELESRMGMSGLDEKAARESD